MYSPKYVYKNGHYNTIYSSLKLETINKLSAVAQVNILRFNKTVAYYIANM